MRKFFTLFLALLTVSLMANPVDKKLAEQIATNQFIFNAPAGKAACSVVASYARVYEGLTTFYTFNFSTGGFVIVAADDGSIPVLAYSYEGMYDPNAHNPAAEAWLENYSKAIAEISKAKLSNAETRPLWNQILGNGMERSVLDVPALVETTWDQGCYYNALCPLEPGAGFGTCGRAYTGCVATTMAGLMKYHQWPQTGIGYHMYTHPDYGVQTANFGNTTYNFAAMPNSVNSANPSVATLMYHAGVSVNMNYGPDGSGTQSIYVPFALVNYFNYSPSATLKYKTDYPVMADWYTLLRTELDASRPMYYAGSSTASGGHAWICDGYRLSDNKFHMNWGWSGSSNGFFAIGNLNPSGMNFNDDNHVIIGIMPGNNSVTWMSQNSNFTAASRGISYIHAVNETTAWATAYDGSGSNAVINEFTKTSDQGEHWTTGDVLGGSTYGIGNICGLNANVAYVALYNGVGNQDNTCGIYKTSNGGVSWSKLSTALQGSASFANNVYFWDEQNGMCHGDVRDGYFEIYTTVNGGTTWQRVPQANITGGTPASGEGGWTSVIEVAGENTVMFGTNKGKVYISDDRGFHWRVTNTNITPGTNGGINQIAFTDPEHGIVVQTIAPVSYRKTSNGGLTWETFTPNGPLYLSGLAAVPGSNGIYVSTGAAQGATGISYSTDGGLNWTLFGGTADLQYLATDYFNNSVGFAGGFNDENGNNGMFKMEGMLGTAPGAQILADPQEINAELYIGQMDTVSFFILNNGDATLEWSISLDGAPNWLTLSQYEGTTPASTNSLISVYLNAATFEPGVYESALVITNNSVNDPELIVPVRLVIEPMLEPPTNATGTVNLYDIHLQWNAPAVAKGQRELLGYNVYRNGNRLNSELLTETFYDDIAPEIGTFEYNVRAVYTEGESGNSNTVVIIVTSTNDISTVNNLMIYPNPANSVITVKSDKQITEVAIITHTGKVLQSRKTDAKEVSFNVSDLHPGIYLIRAKTSEGFATSYISINR